MKQHRMAALAAAAALAITRTARLKTAMEHGKALARPFPLRPIMHTVGIVRCMSLTAPQAGAHLAVPCPALPYRGRPIPFLLMLCLQMGTIIRTWH